MKITDAQLKQIYAHAKETYPHECCGFLLPTFLAESFQCQRTGEELL